MHKLTDISIDISGLKRNETNGCKKGEVKYGEAEVFQFRSTDK